MQNAVRLGLNRRAVVIGAAATSLGRAAGAAPAWPQSIAAPQDLGFADDLAEKLDAGVRSGLLRGLHSVVIMRSGRLVLERYFEGEDESWGRPLGPVSFEPDTLHDLRSVTKSVVSLLYGIALDRGLVPGPDAPLMAQFPEYPDLAADPARALLKVLHALTMTMGLEWNEQVPAPANSEVMMERAPDRYRFILERPVVFAPGTRWTYSGGCAALLGRLITKGAGRTLSEFVRETLFADLGISTFEWARGDDGVESAASGLRLKPRDLARVGELVLANGKAGERQTVSRAWIEASLRPAIPTGDGLDYGRMWFLGKDATPATQGPQRWVAGFGNGGQRLWIMPSADLAAVIMAGNYDSPAQWVAPVRVWREIVLANLLKL
jgi:CubicO group peptidase (beta-lactamase class C family)